MEPRTSSTNDSPSNGFRPVVGAPPPPPGAGAAPVPPADAQETPPVPTRVMDAPAPTQPVETPGAIEPPPPPAEPSAPSGPFDRQSGNGSGPRGAHRLDVLARTLRIGSRPNRVTGPAQPGVPQPGVTPPGVAPPAWAGLLRAMRPKQWTKNVLVFAAPGAAGVLFHGWPLLHALVAFVLFSAVASGTYLLNDTMDAPADRQHPVKRNRPIAAGLVSPRTALVAAGALMAGGIALGSLLRLQLGLVLGIYVALQLAYSAYLKHQPVYDITCVAGGFLLRAIAGAVAIPVAVSEWFLIVTTFGSLLMVTGKRLAEHAELGEGRGGHRATLDAYSISFLRIVVGMSATGAVVGYALWAFGLEAAAVAVRHHDGIFFQLSIVPVLLALLHFTLLIERGRGARPEELVLGDRQLQILGAIWLLLFALGVYG